MHAIDWYLSSVRWGVCMHNHNYRWVWSLIYSRFIFVDAFHLYSLALWTWKVRFTFTLLRSDAACCHITFILQSFILSLPLFLYLSVYLSIHPYPPSIKSIHVSGKLPCPLIEDTVMNIWTLWDKLLPHLFSQTLIVNAPARTLLQFQNSFIIKCVPS